MKALLERILLTWPKYFIKDRDLAVSLKCTSNARHSLVKRAKQKGMLIHLKKGLYLIGNLYRKTLPNLFEVAQLLHGPSFISLESALSFHQWIPEATYTVTNVCTDRVTQFKTSLGIFSFTPVPSGHFYLGVDRVVSNDNIFLIASPWRALADYMYTYKKLWNTLNDITEDLRVEFENFLQSDRTILQALSENYPHTRVRKQLKAFLQELNEHDRK